MAKRILNIKEIKANTDFFKNGEDFHGWAYRHDKMQILPFDWMGEYVSDIKRKWPLVDDIAEWMITEDKESQTIELPLALTAELGHKSLLRGEFHESIMVPCTCCEGDDEECSECGGDNEGVERLVPISWDTIKDIYKKIVEYHQEQKL